MPLLAALAHCYWDWRVQRCYRAAAFRLWRAMWTDLRRYCGQQLAIEALESQMRLARVVAILRRHAED